MVRIPRDFVQPGSAVAGTIDVRFDVNKSSQVGEAGVEVANQQAADFQRASAQLTQQMQQYQEEQGKNYYYANILGMQEQNMKAMQEAQQEAGPSGAGLTDLYKQKMQAYIDPILQNAPDSKSRDRLMGQYVDMYGSSIGHALKQQAAVGLYNSTQQVMQGINSQIYQLQQDASKDLDSAIQRGKLIMEAADGMSAAGASPVDVMKRKQAIQDHVTMSALMAGAETQPQKAMDYANKLGLAGMLTPEQVNSVYVQANKAVAAKAKADQEQLEAAKGIELYNNGNIPGEGLGKKGVELGIQKLFTGPQPDGKPWAERPFHQVADKILGTVRANTQYMPEYLIGVIKTTLNNPKADPKDIASAANVIDTLSNDKNMNEIARKSFSADDLHRASYIANYTRVNNDPAVALEMANQTLAKPTGIGAEVVAANLANHAKDIQDFSASSERAGFLTRMFGGEAKQDIKANAEYDTAARLLIESYMKQGYSFEVSKDKTQTMLSKRYDFTEVNGTKELVRNPIEQVTKSPILKVKRDLAESLGLTKEIDVPVAVGLDGVESIDTTLPDNADRRVIEITPDKLKALGVPLTDRPTPGGTALVNNSQYDMRIEEADKDPIMKDGKKIFFYKIKFSDAQGNSFTLPQSIMVAQQDLDPDSKKENEKVKFMAESLRASRNEAINRVKNLQIFKDPKTQKTIDNIWSD